MGQGGRVTNFIGSKDQASTCCDTQKEAATGLAQVLSKLIRDQLQAGEASGVMGTQEISESHLAP